MCRPTACSSAWASSWRWSSLPDPLKLCIFATVALLGWVAGPFAVLFFGGLGFVGYWKARRSGLLRSKCLLGDTRIVLVYLALIVIAGGTGVFLLVH